MMDFDGLGVAWWNVIQEVEVHSSFGWMDGWLADDETMIL